MSKLLTKKSSFKLSINKILSKQFKPKHHYLKVNETYEFNEYLYYDSTGLINDLKTMQANHLLDESIKFNNDDSFSTLVKHIEREPYIKLEREFIS